MAFLNQIFGQNSKGENGLSIFMAEFKKADSASKFRVLGSGCTTYTGRVLTEILPTAIKETRQKLAR